MEATATGLGEIPARELDLENAMLSPEEGEKQQASGKDKMEGEEGYAKVYTKTHEKRAERSLSRSERREQEQERKRRETARKEAQKAADRRLFMVASCFSVCGPFTCLFKCYMCKKVNPCFFLNLKF